MVQIFPLSEGTFTVGHDKEFVPFDTANDVLNERPTGSLLVEVQPFLVVTSRDIIVFDAGLGFRTKDGALQIHENIRNAGFEPEDVTKVLMSHLHKDHAGCMSYEANNGLVVSTFPNATYFIYRDEADFALKTGKPSFFPHDIEPILASGQVAWLEGESGVIDNYISFEHSGGHSPHHIVFLIDNNGEKVFYGGDEAPQLKQLKIRYVAKYDFDGKKALKLREHYVERATQEKWKVLFYHDIKVPVGQF